MLARDLRYFVALARLKHYGRASQRLGISQPALTKSTRRLELQVGVTLVETSSRGTQLTPAGELFAKRAHAILSNLDAALAEACLSNDHGSGFLRIGAGPVLAHTVLPTATAHLLEKFPEVVFSIHSDVNTRLLELLIDGRLDIVFCTTFEAVDHADLYCENLGQDELSVILRKEHPLMNRTNVQMSDLVGYEWIMQHPNYLTRKWLDLQFEKSGLPPISVRIETCEMRYVNELLQLTDLITYLPNQTAAAPLALLAVPGLEWVRDVGVVYHRSRFLHPSAKALIEATKRTFKISV